MHGLAEPDSVAWRVNQEVALLLSWGCAILMQFAHPLVAQGIADHSRFLRQPRGRIRRLRQTVRAMLQLTFGTHQEVADTAAGINAIHDTVQGTLGERVGVFGPETTYSAHDPELLRWVQATLVYTFLKAYQLFVGPLSPAEQDRYCAEATGLAPWLGVPEGFFPENVPAVHRYMSTMEAGGQIAIGSIAQKLAQQLLSPPLLRLLPPLLFLIQLPTIGLLPDQLRRAYGLRWTRWHQRAFLVEARLIRFTVGIAPGMLRHWPTARRRHR